MFKCQNVRYLRVYLKVGQAVGSPDPSCPLCLMMVMGDPGIPGTGSCWTGSRSQCMQVPNGNTQCVSELHINFLQKYNS